MKREIMTSYPHRLAIPALLLTLLISLTGCHGLGTYDDLEECPRGVTMRFVFDHNLEFANAFPNNVDCLTVYLFDEEGNLVERRTETSSVLADEDWRMTWDIPAGDYQVVAYGGMECDMASFSHTLPHGEIRKIKDLEVLINEEHVGEESSRPAKALHDHFHGMQSFTVNEGTTYDKTTVKMMRNTNHIRIVLQHLDYTPVNDKDFRFEILDDNILLDHKNDIVPHRTVTYTPWNTGTATTGQHGADYRDASRSDDVIGENDVQVAYADLSVSRLVHRSAFRWNNSKGESVTGPRLRISSKKDGHTVADLPLNNYLLMTMDDILRSKMTSSNPKQEFLDRASHYNLVFFLDKNDSWKSMNIVVENWTVRINDIENPE